MAKTHIWLCHGLNFFLVVTYGRIQEKTDVACNGPCGQLSLSCPAEHKVAIRDAVYRVQDRTDACTPFPGCQSTSQDVCCDPTPQDCVFGYSPAHLKVLQHNCSGTPACKIQTERSDVETVQCSSTDVKNLSSHTILNYVCVNETMIADVCSPKETVLQGKTLFAKIDPRESSRPMKGSVCTCIAESTKWPTTNNIAVFVVDMRLNKPESSKCSNVSLSIRSGNNKKSLDCESARDARINFPFVALLNDSNVAHLRLQLPDTAPEFLWLGFEANEDEDIRLSCKLEGLVPTDSATQAPTMRDIEEVLEMETETAGNVPESPFESNQPKKKEERPVAAITGGIAAAFLIIIIIVIVVVIVIIKRRQKSSQGRPKEAEETDSDIVYYSTTGEEIRYSEQSGPASRSPRVSTDSTKELYIPAEEVIANKRRNKVKRVRIISTPDYVDDVGEEYVSTFQILERKRESREAKNKSGKDKPSIDQTSESSTKNTNSSNYDRLEREPRRPSDSIMESYDQLEPDVPQAESYSSVPEIKVQRSESKRPLVSVGDGGRVNSAYEETEVLPRSMNVPIVSAADEAQELYFELEIPSNKRHSDCPYYDHQGVAIKAPRKMSVDNIVTGNSPNATTSNFLSVNYHDSRRPSTLSNSSTRSSDGEGSIYNDARSEPAPANTSDSNSSANVSENVPVKKPGPVAAPRRKSKETLESLNYDVAKPIQ